MISIKLRDGLIAQRRRDAFRLAWGLEDFGGVPKISLDLLRQEIDLVALNVLTELLRDECLSALEVALTCIISIPSFFYMRCYY